MKKALLGMALLVLAAPAFASTNEIEIPALTPIPFIVSTPGDLLYGYVKNWGSLGDENGQMTKLASQVADQLQESNCAFNFRVSREASGRLLAQEVVAHLACRQADNSLIVTEVPGHVWDKDRIPGLKSGEVGEKGFFVITTTVHIPL
nr:hypothetical protein [Pseudomonas fluorescens]